MKSHSAAIRRVRGESDHNPTYFLTLHKTVSLLLNPSSSTTMSGWEGERKGA